MPPGIVGRVTTSRKGRSGELGAAAEERAARFLVAQGVRVVERNWRCRGGEIDLVCDDRGTLVFVEVRLRAHDRYGGSAESITRAKQRRIVMAARHYLAAGREPPCRFDAVLLSGESDAIEWIRNAFDAD